MNSEICRPFQRLGFAVYTSPFSDFSNVGSIALVVTALRFFDDLYRVTYLQARGEQPHFPFSLVGASAAGCTWLAMVDG
jgi:hypothetical protein